MGALCDRSSNGLYSRAQETDRWRITRREAWESMARERTTKAYEYQDKILENNVHGIWTMISIFKGQLDAMPLWHYASTCFSPLPPCLHCKHFKPPFVFANNCILLDFASSQMKIFAFFIVFVTSSKCRWTELGFNWDFWPTVGLSNRTMND